MAIHAAMDIGSNSVKQCVARRDAAGQWQDLDDRNEITRLSQDLHTTGIIGPTGWNQSLTAIIDFASVARELGAKDIVAVGTMCLRTAANAVDFVAAVQDACRVHIEVISGEEEARLAYLGVLSGLGELPGQVAVFDIGGGSTEIIFGRGKRIASRESLDVGAVRLTEEYLVSDPVTADEYARMLARVHVDLADFGSNDPAARNEATQDIDNLVGIGGTVTNLSAIKLQLAEHDPARLQGTTLTREDLDHMVQEIKVRTIAERRQIVGLQPKRADVILAGTGIARVVMDHLDSDLCLVSTRGVRHGLLVDRYDS